MGLKLVEMVKFSEKPRINMLNSYLKNEFGEKTIKLSLDGDFTCPNRDGTLGFGGCSFCSEKGSGDNASLILSSEKIGRSIKSGIDNQINLLSVKWPNAKYIAYFQNFTSTYGPIEKLEALYSSALSDTRISGLAVATRPDCLGEDVLKLLSEINKNNYLWIELGLQTSNDETAAAFGRMYKTEVYREAADKLSKLGIRFVTHILLGLPGETREDMFSTLDYVVGTNPWGIKFHLLNIIKGTRMANELPNYVPFDSPDEYVSLVCDLLEYVPENVVIHRLSADSPASLLIAPKWAYRKRKLIDMIFTEMERRNSYQGMKL